MDEKKTKKKKSKTTLAVGLTFLITLAGAVGATYWAQQQGLLHSLLGGGGGKVEQAADGSKTVYVGPMHPWIVSDKPGTCPICGMDLVPKKIGAKGEATAEKPERVILYWRSPSDPSKTFHQAGKDKDGRDLIPVYQDEVIGGVEVKIDPTTQQNMGLRTAKVERIHLTKTIRTYGRVTYDETMKREVNLKFSGWIEKLFVDFSGQLVKKGDPLFEIYSPEVVQAAEEYLVVIRKLHRLPGLSSQDLRRSGRRKLQFWDVPEEEIKKIEQSSHPLKTILIRSPFTGVVVSKNVVEGGYIKAGTPLYSIADLSLVWIEAHIYEYELPWVEVGQQVEVTLPYQPGKTYVGRISYIYPYLERKTRDVVIRLELNNPNLVLKPDMYADVRISDSVKSESLVVPSEAIIRSGERNLVFVARGDGRFSPRKVTLGVIGDGGKTQILNGLAEGEWVVASGQFLLDSESKLREAVEKMMSYKTAETTPPKTEKKDDFFSDLNDDKADASGESSKKKDGDFFSDM